MPQHRRVLLDIQPVLQPQRAKLVLGQFPGEEPARLVAELGNAFVDEALVKGVVPIHARRTCWGDLRRRVG